MFSFLWSALVAVSFAQEKIQVTNVTPQGYVSSVEQVRVEFSHPMVKFGDIKLDSPVKSDCFKNGQGRWIDTRNWVYDFNEPLRGGHACSLSALGQKFQFNTGGPHVLSTFPPTYKAIDPQQYFVLMLDAPVKKESIEKGAYFVVEGLGDRLPAQLVDGSEAAKIKAAAESEYKYDKESFKGDFVVVKSTRAFPPGGRLSLVWSKQIQSVSGSSSPEDVNFEFKVEEPFKAEFSCDREAPGKPCVPILGMRLTFTAPVKISEAKKIYLEGPDKKKIFANLTEEATQETANYLEFKGPFAKNTSYKLVIPTDLKDEENRSLANKAQFPLTVKTGEDPSLLKFTGTFGVIEAGPEAALAVTLRRVEKSLQTRFSGWTGQWTAADFKKIVSALNQIQKDPTSEERLALWKNTPFEKIQVQKPLKASDTEVVGIPLKKTGFYAVEMESSLLGQSLLNKKAPFYVRTAALVTKMAVHIKHNGNEAWVWVTELKNSQVVSGANVKIYDLNGDFVAQATTDSKGLAYIQFKNPVSKWPRNENSFYYDGFYAVAEKAGDFSFTHTSWDSGIESWRYQLGGYDEGSPLIGHAVVDRTLLRPGEALSAKIVLRKTAARGLEMPSASEWPTTLIVNHDSGLQSFKLPLKWDQKKGFALVQWHIPAGAKLGRWSLTIEKKNPALSLNVGEVSVESFRVPLIQVRMDATKPVFVQEKNVGIQISGVYFAGGPASELPMKMSWSVEPDFFLAQDEDLRDFSFANGVVKEGLFRSGEDETARHIPQSGAENIKLSNQGQAVVEIKGLKYGSGPQRLRTDVEYKDPNGEIQNAVRSFSLWPANVVLGIKSKSWWATADLVEFEVVALDLMQRPLVKQKVQVDLYTSRYYTHRKRLVGGFYAYEDFQEYRKIGELCKGETNDKGLFSCAGKSKVSGSVIAVVTTKDKDGRESAANVTQWILRTGETQWFGSDDHDRADLVPFKKSYEPGETAEFQLRTPFPQAKVLVTVEREGVLSTEIVDVKGDRPIIRVPIKKEYAPNVVVSAFAIRGRLNDPKPTALVDLGKPAFKLGMTNIKVGRKENTLKVSVQTDRKKYKAREKATVTVKVQDAQGKPAAQSDVALIAVDEGLLELRDNSSWNLLDAMMKPRAHLVQMATAQTLVVGKRHFGLKAVPIGGDGGGALRRELFDTLLYWNPSVKLNAQGEAKVEIKLNDSTTSFRIVAVAIQGKDQFGTGWTSIQSSQDIMILPGLAGVARTGDEFLAGFTIRNASEQTQSLDVSLQVHPLTEKFSSQKMTLKPQETKEVFWKIKVPESVKTLDYVLTAKNAQGKAVDEIKKSQAVLPLRSATIYQSQWGAWPEFNKLSLQQPAGAERGQSSILVEVQEGLGGSLLGLKDFWENYSYTCLEQQVSRAVSLNDKKLWKKIEEKLNVYVGSDGLLQFFPANTQKGNLNLTAYILNVAHEAGFAFSEENESRLLDTLTAYAEGRLKEDVEFSRADEVLKKVTVFETLSRYRRFNVDWLSTVEFQGNQWPLYTLVEWYQIHQWEKSIPEREKKLADIEKILRSRFYFSAKKLQLREEDREAMPWLMRDSEGALLRLILASMNSPSWKTDVPRLYQGALDRQKNGAWMLTSDNAWGRLAMRKINEAYSSGKVQGTFSAQLDNEKGSYTWSKGPSGSFELPWKEEKANLVLQQEGAGKPWITVSAKAAIPVTQSVFAGFTVTKTVSPVTQKKKGVWSVGDIAKVTLRVQAKVPQSWVVVEDPIPVGARVTESSWANAIERKEEMVRFYYSWFDASSEVIEYTIRFNQAGTYRMPKTHVEAMYSPDLYADLPEGVWKVEE
ncbi:alpha-2-macroglobulin [Bdellovibrio bacteriovorus]|uniref:alpha-2-macroglobulin family protein n=1 Tax=Bdellovibrio bacteriovorus TaxID=959 RepID=UPI0035A6CCF8